MDSKGKMTRREFFKNSTKVGLGLAGGASIIGKARTAYPQSKLEKIEIRIGYQPYGGGNCSNSNYMAQTHIFAKYAEEYGYDVQETFVPLLSGPVINEGLLAKKLELGQVGPYPSMSMLAAGAEVYIIGVPEGHSDHAMLVRPNSPFRSIEDLIKKKAVIGLVLGSSAHQFIESVCEVHYKKSAKELGLVLTDMPTTAQATFPQGVDAVIPWAPMTYVMEGRGLAVRLLSLTGRTGKAHELGEGKTLPGFEKSWAYPEAYALHRNTWLIRREVADKHPRLIVAFMRAFQDTVYTLHRDLDRAFEASQIWWRLPKETAMAMLKEELLPGLRDWGWATDGDLSTMVFTSKWLHPRGAIKRVVTWDIIKDYVKPWKLVQEAYEKGTLVSPPKYPSIEEMTKTTAVDKRGYPVWMQDKWRLVG